MKTFKEELQDTLDSHADCVYTENCDLWEEISGLLELYKDQYLDEDV